MVTKKRLLKTKAITAEFDVLGFFYESSGHKFRKYLDIKEKYSKLEKPDLMVVMMNPGSSYPLDGKDNGLAAVATRPDRTQFQIMAVMERTNLRYARILNLSDKRESKCTSFYSFLKSKESNALPHSIFHDSRIKDFENVFIDSTPVVSAWGVNSCLFDLARTAMNRLPHDNVIGIKKQSLEYAYYHPLPRGHQGKNDWVSQVSQQIILKQSNANPELTLSQY